MALPLVGAIVAGIGFVGSAFALSFEEPVIESGFFSAVDLEGCQELGNCAYQNGTGAPYGRTVLIDLTTKLVKPDEGLTPLEVFLGGLFLKPNQALVMAGPVPISKYWSFTCYNVRNVLADGEQNPVYLLASLSQGVNNFGYPGAKTIAIIATRNQNVFNSEKYRLTKAKPGITVIPLWIPDQAPINSVLSILSRTALFPEGGVDSYVADTGMVSYRSTYSNIGFSPVRVVLAGEDPRKVPLGILPLIQTPHPFEPSELPLKAQYDNYTNSILAKYTIIREIEVSPAFVAEYGFLLLSGYDCINRNINCYLDNQNTIYITSEHFSTIIGQSVLAVGVNHTLTQRGFYTSLSIYDEEIKYGIDSELAPTGQLFYNTLWSYSKGDYRVVERAYDALPNFQAGPDARTLLLARVFIIKTPPGSQIIDRNAPPPVIPPVNQIKTTLNPNTRALTDIVNIDRRT